MTSFSKKPGHVTFQVIPIVPSVIEGLLQGTLFLPPNRLTERKPNLPHLASPPKPIGAGVLYGGIFIYYKLPKHASDIIQLQPGTSPYAGCFLLYMNKLFLVSEMYAQSI